MALAPVRARVAARTRRPIARAFPVLAQPDLQRAEYFQALRKVVAAYTVVLMRHLSPVLEALPAPTPREDALRLDAGRDQSEEDVRKAIRAAAREVVSAVSTGRIERLTEETAADVSNFGRQQLRRAFSDTLGINLQDAFTSEPRLRDQVAEFTKENVALIRSIPDKYFAQVQQVVLEGVQKGQLAPEIAKRIQERTGVAESRAALIARDQVGKFNGALNAARMKALGVKRFRWRTMRDNRVRRDHEDLEGKVFAFDEPPPEGLPGHPVNCRCYAEPLVDEVLDEETETPPAPEEERVTETVTEVPVPAFVPVPIPFVLPPPPRGEIRGDGAAVAAAHPVLAQTLGAKLRVDDFDSDMVKQHVADLASLPPQMLESIVERLTDVHISVKPLTEMGASGATKVMDRQRQEAFARGETLTGGDTRNVAEVGGMFVRARRNGVLVREVLVSESVPHGSFSTAIHEFAHAVDFELQPGKRLSEDPEFVSAWEHFVGNASHRYADNPYLTDREDDHGIKETFAEGLALYYKHGYSSVAQAFGFAVAEYLDKHFSAEAWGRRAQPPPTARPAARATAPAKRRKR